jgi:thioesterase domain-containing protein/aryl carrier-like protein
VDPDASFDHYGLDSVMVMRLTESLEQRFGKLAPAVFFEHPTVTALAEYLAANHPDAAGKISGDGPAAEASETARQAPEPEGLATAETASVPAAPTAARFIAAAAPALPPELVPIQPQGSRAVSFWVHGLPGFAQGFRRLAQALGTDYPVYAFQARGVDGRRMPFLSVPEMAAHYVACLRQVQPRGPYFLGGQSSGGLIAYEMAQQLHAAGEQVGHLVMLDTYPPTAEMGERFRRELPDEIGLLAIANLFLRYGEGVPAPIAPEELRAVPDGLRVGYLVRRILTAGTKMSADWLYNHLQGAREVTEFTGEAIRAYEARPYAGSEVTYFRSNGHYSGADNAIALPERSVFDGFDYVRPWIELMGERLSVVPLEGDHFGLLEDSNLKRIREVLCNILLPAGFA